MNYRLHVPRVLAALGGVALITFLAHRVISVNATTVGFAYLLLVLVVAATWGFLESVLSALAATFGFNFFFLPPVGTLTISDPQNWVALFSFLASALIASRLSARARERTLEAIAHQQDVERLYTFSRAILLIGDETPFAKQLTLKLAEVFDLTGVILYDRRSGEFHRAGPAELKGVEEQLRDSALGGTTFADTANDRLITGVRLGSEPIAGLALQGAHMSDGVLQGVANLVAIGLERARAQDLAHQIEAARESEQLRTTLIDAMAHEFKTPLTSIKAATTSLRANPEQAAATRAELIEIADEEAEHLKTLIDDSIEMARLDTARIEIEPAMSDLSALVREEVAASRAEADGRPVDVSVDSATIVLPFDRRLVRLALRQLLDNAFKYSTPATPVIVRVSQQVDEAKIEVENQGPGIPQSEQSRVFQRFYRSPSVKNQMPGTGLGLSIAHSIAKAHQGDLTVTSRPGLTTFTLVLPENREIR